MRLNNQWFDVHSMDVESFISKHQILKLFENMFVIFVSSKIVITNFHVHEWENTQHIVDWRGGIKLTFEHHVY